MGKKVRLIQGVAAVTFSAAAGFQVAEAIDHHFESVQAREDAADYELEGNESLAQTYEEDAADYEFLRNFRGAGSLSALCAGGLFTYFLVRRPGDS